MWDLVNIYLVRIYSPGFTPKRMMRVIKKRGQSCDSHYFRDPILIEHVIPFLKNATEKNNFHKERMNETKTKKARDFFWKKRQGNSFPQRTPNTKTENVSNINTSKNSFKTRLFKPAPSTRGILTTQVQRSGERSRPREEHYGIEAEYIHTEVRIGHGGHISYFYQTEQTTFLHDRALARKHSPPWRLCCERTKLTFSGTLNVLDFPQISMLVKIMDPF